jgi:transposase
MDLRERVVAEIAAGSSRHRAAARFKVSASSAIRWARLVSETGAVAPRARGGKSRSPLEGHKDWLLSLVAAEPDLTLEEIVTRVRKSHKFATSEGSLRRFFKRHKITFKKNRARRRAGAARRGASAQGLEGWPSRARSRQARVCR